MKCEREKLSINMKYVLTISEAAEYTNIGQNKIAELLNNPQCEFCIRVGRKRLIIREKFEEFISHSRYI